MLKPLVDSVRRVAPSRRGAGDPAPAALDAESRRWLDDLRGSGRARETPSCDCTRCSCAPRASRSRAGASTLGFLRGGDHDDLAQQAADDALVAILRKLDEFRGESRFTTWAYKFALSRRA